MELSEEIILTHHQNIHTYVAVVNMKPLRLMPLADFLKLADTFNEIEPDIEYKKRRDISEEDYIAAVSQSR